MFPKIPGPIHLRKRILPKRHLFLTCGSGAGRIAERLIICLQRFVDGSGNVAFTRKTKSGAICRTT